MVALGHSRRPIIGHHGQVDRTEIFEAVRLWLAQVLPPKWSDHDVVVDNDEILVVVAVPPPLRPTPAPSPRPRDEPTPGATSCGVAHDIITAFREATRAERMGLAAEAEERFGRKVSWAARVGDVTEIFTQATVPVMTRLRFAERATLDILIDAGLARSRSEALAWCVRLVGANEAEWIEELRGAFEAVAEVRTRGPRSTREQRPTGPKPH